MGAHQGRYEAGPLVHRRRVRPLRVLDPDGIDGRGEAQPEEEDLVDSVMAHVQLGAGDDGVLIVHLHRGGADMGEAPPLNRVIVLAFGGVTGGEVVGEVLDLEARRRGGEVLEVDGQSVAPPPFQVEPEAGDWSAAYINLQKRPHF